MSIARGSLSLGRSAPSNDEFHLQAIQIHRQRDSALTWLTGCQAMKGACAGRRPAITISGIRTRVKPQSVEDAATPGLPYYC